MNTPQSIADFLRAQLDEDEQIAQSARVEGDLTIIFEPDDGGQDHPGEETLLAHIGNWDPARVLGDATHIGEVETKRRIIDYCESAIEVGKLPPNATWSDDAAGAEVAVGVLRLMTLPYVDHSNLPEPERLMSHVADVYDDRPEYHPKPLPAGAVLTAALLTDRLDKIRSMCTAGQMLYPVIAELRYLADALERLDRRLDL